MRIHIVGGGPGGLYLAALVKQSNPSREVHVFERNRANDTFGFGVVFSDATLENIAAADPDTYAKIVDNFAHWDDIDVHYGGEVIRSTGHGFAGLSRQRLLQLLQSRCEVLGVELHFQHDVADFESIAKADVVVAADGLNSKLRTRFADAFKPEVDWRPNRFTWLGTTRQFPAFTFYFNEDAHGGLWRVHAYNFEDGMSTFIVETTDTAWRNAGMDKASEEETKAFCEALFEKELEGHPLLTNRSIWRQFPTVRNARWYHDNVVLLGDSAHTAHFSIGSGTKLAMEDAIALAQALDSTDDVQEAFARYEAERKPVVSSLQRAAQVSLDWFEQTELYFGKLPPRQFAFSLLTRSLRVTHENLRLRDPEFIEDTNTWFSRSVGCEGIRPPMFTPYKLREMSLVNRVVLSPMCMYSAEDGTPNDWHLVHLGSRAIGGAGLLITEMTNVSRDGRITPGCTGLYKEEHVDAWRRITDFVHTQSQAKIGVQLAHAGRKASTKPMWEGIDQPLDEGNWPIVGPSALPYYPHSQVPREMSASDITALKEDFVNAARMAERAGFDLIELHFAHGYLLHTFLSPLSNQREDIYGGSVENRCRLPLEVFDAVRAVWPDEKPISVRISATDWLDGGITIEDSLVLAAALKKAGCDIIDVSSGGITPESRPEYGRLYQTPFAERIRLSLDMPVMTVGNISSYADCNSVLAAGRADLCVLARAHLFDPYWTRHAAFEQHVPDKAWPDPYRLMGNYTPRFDWSPRGQAKDQR